MIRTSLFLSAAVLLTAVGCGDDEIATPDRTAVCACDDGECREHTEKCTAHAQCVRGMRCQGSSEEKKQCVLESFPRVSSDALTKGFRVSELDLKSSARDGAQVYSFVMPTQALATTCAIFVCEPEFTNISYNDRSQGRINQYERCIARQKVFRQTSSAGDDEADLAWNFALSDLTALAQASDPANEIWTCLGPSTRSSTYPIVESLHVGCWALGDLGVIAATRLIRISVNELPEYGTLPVLSCDISNGAVEGRYCYFRQQLGRCVEDVDAGGCVLGDAGTGIDEDASVPVTTCTNDTIGALCTKKVGMAAVGVCSNGGCIQRTDIEDYQLPIVVSDCAPDVSATRMNDAGAATPTATNADTAGFNCFPSTIGNIGTCDSGRCLPRCVTTKDCTSSYGAVGVMKSNVTCAWSSDDMRGVGVCREDAGAARP